MINNVLLSTSFVLGRMVHDDLEDQGLAFKRVANGPRAAAVDDEVTRKIKLEINAEDERRGLRPVYRP